MVDPRRVEPALAHQPRVLVDADVEQVRQQPDVLPQRQRARGLGLGPGGEVEVPARAVLGQAQLHAHRVVAREGALVDPLQAQAHAGCAGAGQRRRAVRQQQRPGAIGQHPAQEVRVEIAVVAAGREARALEEARGHLARHRQRRAVRPHLHALRRRLDRRHAGRADAVHRQRLHRRRRELALDHVGEARHQRIAARGAAGQQRDARELGRALLEAVADGARRQLGVAVHRAAFGVDRVVALADAVLGQDAPLDALRHPVERRDVGIHAFVGHRFAGHEVAGAFEVDALEWDGHGIRAVEENSQASASGCESAAPAPPAGTRAPCRAGGRAR